MIPGKSIRALNRISLFTVLIVFLHLVPTWGQEIKFPTKPITMVVPYTVGGATDVEARIVASFWKKKLGQSVLVENKAGGGGAIGHREIKRSKPDGYTVGCTAWPDGAVQIARKGEGIGFRNEDFALLGAFSTAPGAVTVRKDGPFKNFKDFVEYAKKNPGKLTIAVAGDIWLLHVIEIEEAFGVKLNAIKFKGGGEVLNALLGGHVMSIMAGVHFPIQGADKGIIALAVTAGERVDKLPNTPIMRELGHDIAYELKRIFVAPAGIPKPVFKKLASTLMELDKDPEFVEKYRAMGQIYKPSFGSELEKTYREANQRIKVKVEKYKNQFEE
jgi:putative tricarboxylic transport membrane protein